MKRLLIFLKQNTGLLLVYYHKSKIKIFILLYTEINVHIRQKKNNEKKKITLYLKKKPSGKKTKKKKSKKKTY